MCTTTYTLKQTIIYQTQMSPQAVLNTSLVTPASDVITELTPVSVQSGGAVVTRFVVVIVAAIVVVVIVFTFVIIIVVRCALHLRKVDRSRCLRQQTETR